MRKVKNDILEDVRIWLFSVFSKYVFVKEVFLVGSILSPEIKDINDVDIIQNIDFKNKEEIENYSILIVQIKHDFLKEFLIPLHITTFTQNELAGFKMFMSRNTYLKII